MLPDGGYAEKESKKMPTSELMKGEFLPALGPLRSHRPSVAYVDGRHTTCDFCECRDVTKRCSSIDASSGRSSASSCEYGNRTVILVWVYSQKYGTVPYELL